MTDPKPLVFNKNGRKLYRVPGFAVPQEILIGYDELMPTITEILANETDGYTIDMEAVECIRQAMQQYGTERMAQAQDQADQEKSDRLRHL